MTAQDAVTDGRRLLQAGDAAGAERRFREAVQAEPGLAEAHSQLGHVLRRLGRPADAVAAYREAVRLRPDHAAAHNSLGVALGESGRTEEAVAAYRRALELRPEYPEALNNLGVALAHLVRPEEAVAAYREAVRARPDAAEVRLNFAIALARLGRADEAVAEYREALRLRPDYPEAHLNLGNALVARGQYAEGLAAFEAAVRCRPGYPQALNNLANALRDVGRHDEALAYYRQALDASPRNPEILLNLAVALGEERRFDECLACLDEALRLKPDYAEAHMNRGSVFLLRGELERGWSEYEWRWRTAEFVRPAIPGPRWDGGPLSGKTLFLHSEQGLGDTLQFVRFAPLLRERAARVFVGCQKALVPLLSQTPGIDHLAVSGQPMPGFDLHAPLQSVPAVLQTSLATVPQNVPYLFARPDLAAHWRRELAALPGFKVGVVWQGNPQYRGDRSRSFPLAALEPLARVPGVRLVSLQKGPGAEQLAALSGRFPVTDLGSRLDEANGPFMDTAAVMQALDLVVCPDTAAIHLAGGLGVRAWLALSRNAHWPWLLEGEATVWYPSVRLFRQERRGEWGGVFARMAAALRGEG